MRLLLSILCGLGAAAGSMLGQPALAESAIVLAQAKKSEGGKIGSEMSPAPAGPADWKTYANDRFGFSVDVPASFKALPPPVNGDGLAFVTKDKGAKISAYGHWHYLERGSLVDEVREEEKLDTDINVTYRQSSPKAFTLSGLAGERIIYIHAVATCKGEAVALLWVEYPQSVKAQFDPLIAHMAKTLRGSNACL